MNWLQYNTSDNNYVVLYWLYALVILMDNWFTYCDFEMCTISCYFFNVSFPIIGYKLSAVGVFRYVTENNEGMNFIFPSFYFAF